MLLFFSLHVSYSMFWDNGWFLNPIYYNTCSWKRQEGMREISTITHNAPVQKNPAEVSPLPDDQGLFCRIDAMPVFPQIIPAGNHRNHRRNPHQHIADQIDVPANRCELVDGLEQ